MSLAEITPQRRSWLERPKNPSGWTDKRIALVKKLWDDGLTCSAIAAEMTEGSFRPTRSAIIGKVHRLGLHRDKGTHKQAKGLRQARGPRRPQMKRIVNHGNRFDARGYEFPELPIPKDDGSDIPIGQRRTLLTLDAEHCHWPFGDPAKTDFFYCGAGVAADGLPYCAAHCRQAYTVPQRAPDRPNYRPAGYR